MRLTIHDETAAGKILNEITISLENELTTVRDIITSRVYSEADEFNRRQPEYFNGLVQPVDAEKTLNGYKLRNKRKVDPEQQCYIALESFQKNGFFILIDDKQAEALDEEVLVTKDTIVSFVKLTPLVGG